MSEPDQEPRRTGRRKVGVDASCHDGDGPPIPIAITDLSEGGCKLEGATGLQPDQEVIVRPQGLDALAGRVRWSHDKAAGIEFASRLHPAVVDHVSGEGAVEGLPPIARRRGSGLTDNFGRPLPALGAQRR